MNTRILEIITCANCKADAFSVDKYVESSGEVMEGRLVCKSCNTWYRIENGILDLLPLSLRRAESHEKFVKKYHLNMDNSGEQRDAHKENQMIFFARFSKTYDKEVAYSPYFSTFDRVVFGDWITKNLKPGNNILDLGCGSGVQSMITARQKIYTLGIDISEEMLLLAQRKKHEEHVPAYLDLIVADAENLPLKNDYFDACFMLGTLHHVKSPELVICNASKKIIKGGTIFTSDNHKSPVRFLFDFLMKIWKLYDEEARDEPMFVGKQLYDWYFTAGVKSKVRVSTYLPPHLFFLFNKGVSDFVLRSSNAVFRLIPYIRNFGGIIVVEGIKF